MVVDPLVNIIFELTTSMLGILLVSWPLLQKYRVRKTRVTLLIFLATTLASIAGFVAGIGRILRFTNWWEIQPGMHLELLAVTLAIVAMADAFFLAFALDVFRGGISQGINKVLLAAFVVAVVGFIVYDVTTGLFVVDTTVPILLFLFGLTCVAALSLTRLAWRASHKFETRVDRLCAMLVGLGPLLLLLALGFQGAEVAITAAMGGITQYTFFYYGGWVLILVAVFVISTGYIQPEWLKRRIQPA